MKDYIKKDPWKIIEEGWNPDLNEVSESLCSIGNGRFGQRANFEEKYTGKTLQGSYVAGVFFPDKTRVGWWKNGYPDYFAKVLNSHNWIGIDVEFDGEVLDLNTCKEIRDFRRVLDMKRGVLERSFTAVLKSNRMVKVHSTRFCSMADDRIGAIRYSITPVDFSSKISLTPYIDCDVENKDSNYEEKFWNEIEQDAERDWAVVVAETKENPYGVEQFQVGGAMTFDIFQNGQKADYKTFRIEREKYAGCRAEIDLSEGEEIVVFKYASILSSMNFKTNELRDESVKTAQKVRNIGFEKLLSDHAAKWAAKWKEADIQIDGDISAQQGIRFNIFHLYQTYTGEDDRLNIGPKGFTGEKYGGASYWDTEAYCIPFYLATADSDIARNLLIYRHKHLENAIKNAAKLGFEKGAALYPMVTMTGEECHNEWEITFEEIHRNGAIAYAIYDYINYTGDKKYLSEYGLEVLISIARFWSQRVHWSERNGQFMMHGVTGPNEYENNVNNNWYTNFIAVWCLKYSLEAMDFVEQTDEKRFEEISEKIKFYKYTEIKKWKEIIEKMYLPEDEELGVFVQHDGFLDKEMMKVTDLQPADRPLNQKWSWDRILRSVFIKQADVLQGLYFFEDQFEEATIRKNFDFYEPMTVHESSLSPCVHSILAASLGKKEKAYEMYARSARLDLEDYNNDTEDGLHITSMAGTWMSVVKGFGGMRVKNGELHFNPSLPEQWKSMTFKIRWRGNFLTINISHDDVSISNQNDEPLSVKVFGKEFEIR